MVDRIVPATTDAYRAAAAAHLGATDAIPVPAEPFTMWVLEDRFAAGRPAWEHGGALFTDDVEPYELLKLRLLNGTHSLIAYLGALDGHATIAGACAQPFVADAARRVLFDEYLPSVTVPADVDLDGYVAQLFERWSNTALGHRTQQVGSDGSVKLGQRVPEPALLQLRAGRLPHHLALTVAAYLCCLAPPPGFDPGPHAAAMADPARAGLVATRQPQPLVRAVRRGRARRRPPRARPRRPQRVRRPRRRAGRRDRRARGGHGRHRGRPRRGRRQSPPLTGAHRVTDRHHHDRSADAHPRGHAVRRP